MLLKAAYSKGLRRSRVFHGFVSPVMLVSQGFQGLMIHVLSVNQGEEIWLFRPDYAGEKSLKASKPYISVLTSFSPEKGVPNSYFCAESFM
jgi:hypothetical protein